MTPTLGDPVEHWQLVATLLDAALERESAAEHARYLDETCRGRPALKAEVESLLARAVMPSFLDSGALVFAAPLLPAGGAAAEDALHVPKALQGIVRQVTHDATAAPLSPDCADLGGDTPYVLERKLARGGMATVYVARDVKHDRRVAVKVLDGSASGSWTGSTFTICAMFAPRTRSAWWTKMSSVVAATSTAPP